MRIYQRGGVWYYVRRVPSDLLSVIGRPVLCRSLKTRDKKNARTLATAQDFRAEQIFMCARGGMVAKGQLKKLVAEYLAGALDRFDDVLMKESFSGDTTTTATVEFFTEKAQELRPKAFRDSTAAAFQGAAENAADSFLKDDFAAVAELGDSLLKAEGLQVSEDERTRLYRELLLAQGRLFRALGDRVKGDYTAFNVERQRAEEERKKNYITFSKLIEEFQASEGKRRKWKAATVLQVKIECALLLELIGDRDLSEVNTRNTVKQCWEELQRYPKNRRKIFKDTPLATIYRRKNYAKSDDRTVNRHMLRLSGLIKFAIAEELMESTINFAAGKQIRIDRLPVDDRMPYSTEDVQRLIAALCEQNLKKRKERFWLILIALFQGFRTAEILKLTSGSIIDHCGVSCFDLLSMGKGSTKTIAGRRIVPIHPMLIELGFLVWARKQRSKLFTDSERSFGPWYNRCEQKAKGFEWKYVTQEPKKTFYSLRHSFCDELKRAGVEEFKVMALMGHDLTEDNSSISTARYGSSVQPDILLDSLKSVRYAGVNFEKLREAAKKLFEKC